MHFPYRNFLRIFLKYVSITNKIFKNLIHVYILCFYTTIDDGSALISYEPGSLLPRLAVCKGMVGYVRKTNLYQMYVSAMHDSKYIISITTTRSLNKYMSPQSNININ